MSLHRKWLFRIQHILDAIHKIQQYTIDMTNGEFATNPLVMDAVIRNFQVIGEAARLVPAEIQTKYEQIPWSSMQKMRHILVHDYDQVNVSIVWTTLQDELPPLTPLLQAILDDEEE